jgi:hypothetical protein
VDEKPKRVSWRNVLLLCVLQAPIWYVVYGYIPTPYGAPRVESPEGRAIFRDFMRRTFPELFAGTGVKR